MALANAFKGVGVEVIRYDLPFRQERPNGPPRPGDAARDREGLKEQVLKAREQKPECVWLGGHSYGGRQASMLAAEEPGLADALLLMSYPLHPPRKPDQLRTAHFPKLETPTLFVHGSRDPFGSPDELEASAQPDCQPSRFVEIESAGHELGRNSASYGGENNRSRCLGRLAPALTHPLRQHTYRGHRARIVHLAVYFFKPAALSDLPRPMPAWRVVSSVAFLLRGCTARYTHPPGLITRPTSISVLTESFQN